MSVLLFIMAIAFAAVLIWLKAAPKVVALLALFIGIRIDGRVEGWIVWVINWLSSWVGRLGHYLVGAPVKEFSAAVPAAVGLVLLVVFVRHMWPKKGKATGLTAAAALLLPLQWAALSSALEQVSPGITGGA